MKKNCYNSSRLLKCRFDCNEITKNKVLPHRQKHRRDTFDIAALTRSSAVAEGPRDVRLIWQEIR